MRWPVSHLVKLGGLVLPPRVKRPIRPARIHYHGESADVPAASDRRAS